MSHPMRHALRTGKGRQMPKGFWWGGWDSNIRIADWPIGSVSWTAAWIIYAASSPNV